MIKTENIVPSNYYTRSRDFQLLGRVLDIVFNSSKGYSDMVQYDTICSNTDYRLLDLIAKAVGFGTGNGGSFGGYPEGTDQRREEGPEEIRAKSEAGG